MKWTIQVLNYYFIGVSLRLSGSESSYLSQVFESVQLSLLWISFFKNALTKQIFAHSVVFHKFHRLLLHSFLLSKLLKLRNSSTWPHQLLRLSIVFLILLIELPLRGNHQQLRATHTSLKSLTEIFFFSQASGLHYWFLGILEGEQSHLADSWRLQLAGVLRISCLTMEGLQKHLANLHGYGWVMRATWIL